MADISADELIAKYASVVAMGSTGKKLTKKLKKVKSWKLELEMNIPQAPSPAKVTQVWSSPISEGMKMEMMGMVVQKSYFDGEQGGSSSMQTGEEVLTPEEIAVIRIQIGSRICNVYASPNPRPRQYACACGYRGEDIWIHHCLRWDGRINSHSEETRKV